MKFRKKPVVIDAIRLNDENREVFLAWAKESPKQFKIVGADRLEIETPEGTMTAIWGDWIIKGVKGEFYPCKSDIFEATYESVE